MVHGLLFSAHPLAEKESQHIHKLCLPFPLSLWTLSEHYFNVYCGPNTLVMARQGILMKVDECGGIL